MPECPFKEALITVFTLMMVVFLSACSENKLRPGQSSERDIAAVQTQKDPAEIYIKPYPFKGLEEENLFVIQGRAEQGQLKRQLRSPIKLHFSSQQSTDNPKN